VNTNRFSAVLSRRAHLCGVLMVAVVSMLATFNAGAQIGGGSWNDDAEPIEQLTADHCARIELEPAYAGPLETVSMADWPEVETSFQGVIVVRLESPGTDDEDAPALALNRGQERYGFHVPVHPSGNPEGGDVEVRFGHVADPESDAYMDSVEWCDETASLRIEALPASDDPARGLDAHLYQLEQLYETAASSVGMELNELVDLPREEVSPEHALLYAGALMLKDERGIHSMIRGMDEEERELADRLLIQSTKVRESRDDLPNEEGFVPVAQSQPGSRHQGPAARQAAEPHARTASPGALGRLSRLLFRSAHAGNSANPAFPDSVKGKCRESDFDELSGLLGYQLSGDAMLSGDPAKFLDIVTPIAGLPGTGLAGDGVVLLSWMTRTVAEKLAHTYPDPRLNRSEIHLDPKSFLEDSTEMGQVEEMRVRFHSRGWDAGPRMAELGMIVANKVGAKLMEEFVMTTRATSDGQGYVFELLGEVYHESGLDKETAEPVNEFLIDTVLWTAEKVSGIDPDETELFQDRSLAAVEPDCWEVVSEPPHWNAGIDFELRGAIEIGTRRGEYRPTSVGSGDLWGTWDFELGKHVIEAPWASATDHVVVFRSEALEIQVKPLMIQWVSRRQRAQAGEEVELRVRVDQAHDGTVEITDSLGQVHTRLDAGEEKTVNYRVPADWEGEEPIKITALSLSTDGLRSPTHPGYAGARSAYTWVLLDRPRPEIVPAQRCIEPGSALPLHTFDTRHDEIPLEVDWATDGGAISPDGTLHAPLEPGKLEVTATPLDSPDAATTALFEVGDCLECGWTLQIGGETFHGETIGLMNVDHESGGVQVIMLRAPDRMDFNVITYAGQGSDANYVVRRTPPSLAVNFPQLPVSIEWPDDDYMNALMPSVGIRGAGSGLAVVDVEQPPTEFLDDGHIVTPPAISTFGPAQLSFGGTFNPPLYPVRLRSPDMLDEQVRERWFADAEAGDHYHYFDRRDTMLECGGEAREQLENNDLPVWPDHQVPLRGSGEWVEDNPGYFNADSITNFPLHPRKSR